MQRGDGIAESLYHVAAPAAEESEPAAGEGRQRLVEVEHGREPNGAIVVHAGFAAAGLHEVAQLQAERVQADLRAAVEQAHHAAVAQHLLKDAVLMTLAQEM